MCLEHTILSIVNKISGAFALYLINILIEHCFYTFWLMLNQKCTVSVEWPEQNVCGGEQ